MFFTYLFILLPCQILWKLYALIESRKKYGDLEVLSIMFSQYQLRVGIIWHQIHVDIEQLLIVRIINRKKKQRKAK